MPRLRPRNRTNRELQAGKTNRGDLSMQQWQKMSRTTGHIPERLIDANGTGGDGGEGGG
jgi:hypothetical protein